MTSAPPRGIAWLVNGSGAPVTVFLPGLGGSLATVRPLGSGVPGTRVFCELGGEGAPDDYPKLAAAAESAVRACGADRALGVSLGAGALLRLLSLAPDLLSKVVLHQPSALDVAPPERLAELEVYLALAESGDVETLAARLLAELSEDVGATRPARDAARVRAERLARPEGLRLLKNLAAGEPPVTDRTMLARVRTEVLVVTGTDDPVHPESVAREIADALPRAALRVLAGPNPLVHARAELRSLVSGFLSG